MEASEIGVNRLYRHADGGIYRTLGFLNVKMDSGEWKNGVRYLSLCGQKPECATSMERFRDRFYPEYDDYADQISE